MNPGAWIPALAGQRNQRYLAGAVLCALVNNVVLIAGDWFSLLLTANVLAAWLAGSLTGYFWHSAITYRSPRSLAGLLRFLTGTLLGIPLAWLVLFVLRDLLGLPMWLASPVMTLVLFLYNYLNARLAIVRSTG